MRNSWIAIVAAMFLSGAYVLAQTPEEKPPNESGTRPDIAEQASEVQKASLSGISSPDRKFLEEAAEGGAAEVAAGKLAQEQAQSPRVKEIGKVLAEDHTKANQQLEQLGSEQGVDLSGQMSAKGQKALSKLRQASGEQFDREFLRQQEKIHSQDIARFEHVARQSEDDAIKQFAEEMLPTLRKHLDLIQGASGRAEPPAEGTSQ